MPSTLYSCSLQVVSNERWSCHEERSSTCNPSMSIMMTNAQPSYCPIAGLPVMLATAGVIVGPLRTRPHPPIEMYTLDQTRWHTVTSPPADRLTTTHPLHDLTPRCYTQPRALSASARSSQFCIAAAVASVADHSHVIIVVRPTESQHLFWWPHHSDTSDPQTPHRLHAGRGDV